jgi:hypothetical protein
MNDRMIKVLHIQQLSANLELLHILESAGEYDLSDRILDAQEALDTAKSMYYNDYPGCKYV